jgi:hypothetical protein
VSKQTFVITPKNYPRPLEVLGEHAAMRASSEVGSELFLKEGSRGSTSSTASPPERACPHENLQQDDPSTERGRSQLVRATSTQRCDRMSSFGLSTLSCS